MRWKNLNLEQALEARRRQHEATMGGNVGAFAVPLGGVLRPPTVAPVDATASPYYGGGRPTSPGYESLDDALDAYAKATKSPRR